MIKERTSIRKTDIAPMTMNDFEANFRKFKILKVQSTSDDHSKIGRSQINSLDFIRCRLLALKGRLMQSRHQLNKDIKLSQSFIEGFSYQFDYILSSLSFSAILDMTSFQPLIQPSSSQSTESSSQPAPRDRIGDYAILKLLQQGGQACVFLTEKEGELFAVKVYHQGERLVRAFQNEAKILSRIYFKGIMPIVQTLSRVVFRYQTDQAQVRNAIVMDFVKNGDLYNQIKQYGCFQEQACRKIVKKLIGCLLYLQNQHILHRDIKPQNVLIGDDFSIYLTDFGLAIEERVNNTGFAGDIRYAAPEVLKQQICNEKSEVFSLGVSLFFMMVGETPFNTAKITDANYRILFEHKYHAFWERIQQKADRKLSQSFKKLIILMLEPKIQKRPSFQELINQNWFQQKQMHEIEFIEYMKSRRGSIRSQEQSQTEIN